LEKRDVKQPVLPSGKWLFAAAVALAALVPCARADYVVLQTGQSIHVTSYERVGDTLHLVMAGGTMEIPADTVARVDPEDTFPAVKIKLLEVPYANFIAASARDHGVAPELVASVITVESNFNPNAVSWRSACGLMQLLPRTARRLGVTNIFDPQQNIEAGTKYLKELLVRYNGDLALTLAAYNAGPGPVQQYKNVPPYRETRDYVRRVVEKYRAASSIPDRIVTLQ
jgi:soluble lytic murein transglycosylase-like protein